MGLSRFQYSLLIPTKQPPPKLKNIWKIWLPKIIHLATKNSKTAENFSENVKFVENFNPNKILQQTMGV